jgi:hypothetical protein
LDELRDHRRDIATVATADELRPAPRGRTAARATMDELRPAPPRAPGRGQRLDVGRLDVARGRAAARIA